MSAEEQAPDRVVPLITKRTHATEEEVLGALLDFCRQKGARPSEFFDIAGLKRSDFKDRRVGNVWYVARYLSDNERLVTPSTVLSAGQPAGHLADSDREWLMNLVSANTLTREAFAQQCADIRQQALGRSAAERLEAAARILRSGVFKPSVLSADVMSVADGLTRSDATDETAASDLLELENKWKERETTGRSPMLRSHVKLLDQATGHQADGSDGGFPPKFAVVMGQPGVGKNMLLAGLIRAMLESDLELKLGLFALEDGSRWLLKRWLARDLGIPLGHVGVVKRTPELLAAQKALNPIYQQLLTRVFTYRWRRIGADDMLHTSRGWIHRHGVRGIFFDNLTHLDTKNNNFHRLGNYSAQQQNRFQQMASHEAIAEATERFAELADAKEVPIIALAHTVRPDAKKKLEARPPLLTEVAGSAGIERVVRFAAGMWRTESRELRLTIQKNTEGPGTDVTIELERIVEAAIIVPSGGRVVSLDQEAREARDAKENVAIETNERRKAKVAAMREKAKAAAAPPEEPKKEEPPQKALFETEPTK